MVVRRPASRLWLSVVSLSLLTACKGGAGDETRGSQPPPPVSATPRSDTPQAADAAAAEPEPEADAPEVANAEPTEPPEPEVPTFGPANLTALSEADRATFLAGEADGPIKVEIHYIQSNETRHDLFFPYLAPDDQPIGGAFIGVGSDQSFTMAAKARSELLFLMDIDYRVVDLHRQYEIFILESETPQALLDLWDRKNRDAAKALLEERLAEKFDAKRAARILRGYGINRETVFRHLTRVLARTRDGAPSSWLSDPENYAHIRALYQTGRVRIMHGNLAGQASLRTAAAAAKELGTPMRVLYMSNAEEYFKYTADFVANINAQNTDESGVVLRTIYSKKWQHADLWAYQVEPILDFKSRLEDRKHRSRRTMLRYAKQDGAIERVEGTGFSTLGMNGK